MAEPKNENWVEQLENKKKKYQRLAHEIGAGSRCLICGDKCPGLDLHFWRKICRNCKCKKDEHAVEDDDDAFNFEIVFGRKVKQQITVLEVKLKLGKDDQDIVPQEVSLDWTPPNIPLEMASEYMEKIPYKNVPLSGSSGGLYRRQQIQRQIPLHDFDPALCHELSPVEVKKLETYASNARQNAAGQAQVVRTPVSKWLISSTHNTLQKPSSSAHLVDPRSKGCYKGNEYVKINTIPGKFQNVGINSKECLESSAELNPLHPIYSQLLTNEGKKTFDNISPDFEDYSTSTNGNKNTGIHNLSTYNNQRHFGGLEKSDLTSHPHHNMKGGNKSVFPQLVDMMNMPKVFDPYAQASTPMHPDPLEQDFLNKMADIRLRGDSSTVPNENTNKGLHNMSGHNQNPQNIDVGVGKSNSMFQDNANAFRDDNFSLENSRINHLAQSEDGNSSLVHGISPNTLNEGNRYLMKNIQPQNPVYLPVQNKNSNLNYSEPVNNHKIGHSQPLTRSNQTSDMKQFGPFNLDNNQVCPDNALRYSSKEGSDNLQPDVWNQTNIPLMGLDNEVNLNLAARDQHPYIEQPYQVQNYNYSTDHSGNRGLENSNIPVSKSNDRAKNILVSDPQNQAYITNLGQDTLNAFEITEDTIDCSDCGEQVETGSLGVVVAKGSEILLWHPGCFKCFTCKEILVDLYYFYHKGKVYCGRDYAAVLNIPRCYACDELIFVSKYTQAEGHSFHLKHFCCSECDIFLADKDYTPINNLPVCLDCYYKKYAKVCGTCHQKVSILDTSVKMNDLIWHANIKCFACHYCLKSLINTRFVIKNNSPYCNNECVLSATLNAVSSI